MFTSNRATCLICKQNICQSILKSFKTLQTLTVRMSRHTSFPNALNCHILNICLRASVTPATLWASVTLVTGSDVSRSSRRDSNTCRNTISLQHADPGEHFPALMIRHRPDRSRSCSYDSVSLRRHSRSTSRSRGKKKKFHKKRKHSSTSSSSSCRSSSPSSSESERERKRHKSKKKKKKHSKSHSSKRDKSKKKHKRKRNPSLPPSPLSSSVYPDSSSSPWRSPARKKSRISFEVSFSGCCQSSIRF